MQPQYNIFLVREVSFTEGERDPFWFDDFAEKLGEEYLPFSGTVAKPSYFLFVAYVHDLLKNNHFGKRTKKEENEIKIRLEKLLVFCWKNAADKNGINLRGKGVIGNSRKKADIDVFSVKDWVKQNCYKIYTHKFTTSTLEEYLRHNDRIKEIELLKEFVHHNRNIGSEEFLSELVKNLQKVKSSVFRSDELSDTLKKMFKRELKKKIEEKKKAEYFEVVKPYFQGKRFKFDEFLQRTIGCRNKHIPFFWLNQWFEKFIRAVDADIQNKDDSARLKLWNEADNAFTKIPEDFRSKSKVILEDSPKNSKWFEYYPSNPPTRYVLPKDNAARLREIKRNWDTYKKRAGEKSELGDEKIDFEKYFFNYRHYAFGKLLKELE